MEFSWESFWSTILWSVFVLSVLMIIVGFCLPNMITSLLVFGCGVFSAIATGAILRGFDWW